MTGLCTRRVRHAHGLRSEGGFTLVEVLVAILILCVGIIGLFTGFIDSQKLSLASERQTTMSHMAQREIERIEGLAYASIGMTGAPATSASPQNPDYYVNAGSTPTYEWNQTAASAEPIDVDTTNGTIAPVQSWTEGTLSGSIYDFVTWTTDTACSPGCPSSSDYKRITVAVTVSTTSTSSPSPAYVSSVIVNPNAAPAQGTANGTSGNPISNGSTSCATVTGTTTTQGTCESPIDGGVPNTVFLHDCLAGSTSCTTPTASNTLHSTVGTVSGLTCSTALSVLGVVVGSTAGCPVPDDMNTTPPSGGTSTSTTSTATTSTGTTSTSTTSTSTTTSTTSTPVYQYSTNLGTTGYTGGRLLLPLCGTTSGCGTGSASDCSGAVSWASSLLNAQNELWVTPPLATSTTLTGEGALNLYTQTQNGASAVVTLCIEFYEIPPSSGVAGSLSDLLAFPPTALGGAAYVAPTNPSTGSNWPATPTNVDYEFDYAPGGVTVPAGDRIGVRVWMVANVNNAIALLYDNPNYPSELQLNSQSTMQFTGS